MPMTQCAYLHQPSAASASHASTGTSAGKISRLYCSGCSSKSSQHGIETTAARRPRPLVASMSSCTSEPVPTSTTSAGGSAAGSTTYAPLATASTLEAARLAQPWRESAITHGVRRRSSAIAYAPDTSLASAGRSVSVLGVARKLSSASTGWWVGPSSPSPIESCVATVITPNSESAETRIAPSPYAVKLRNVAQNGMMPP
mmetsp:Transcript_39885/g.109850  ORF Transcript_39885/g.109850 Transcript_39885/m.109850 type:complete len:201 (+) Transcript_39885:806-1408(+)